MTLLLFIMLVLFYQGVFVFSLNRKHLLIMLLSLEFLVLNLFLMLMLYLELYWSNMYYSMIFLTFMVCESSLGLSILVSLVRTHGNDYFNVMSIM
uniref:NADH-ubiquinone oxidoreductase chain 4L n=1 Tax=Cephalcia yanqingensis TaxID=2853409 RepID=A0A8H2SJ42_9HYME|nr:NADH dehydrogenase subunit 4L [Cephalcia yanqingensis]